MDRAILETLKRLESESTPGPWEVDYQPPGASGAKCYMCGITANVDGARFDVVRQGQTNERTWPRVIKNGLLIAAMRNALPGLMELAQVGLLAVELYKVEHNGDVKACNPQWEALNDACNAYTVINMSQSEIRTALLKWGYTEEELQVNQERMRERFAAFREKLKAL